MYEILNDFMSPAQITMAGVMVAFLLTFIMLKIPFKFLPADQGRAFAVNGELSKGKTRGVGLIFVFCFLVCGILFLPITMEFLIYAILIMAICLSGYLDDASDKPWSDYKKGLIDLVISVVTMWNFVNYNSTTITAGKAVFEIPVAVYFILGIILIWVSINVTNCSDGVDGLCANLSIVTLASFAITFPTELGDYGALCFIFIAVLMAYLYFNSSPSTMLMGDAGSRALGFFIALVAMKCGQPLVFLLFALMLIIDGGIGLVKIFLLRFFKISILKNTRTPLHDQARKVNKWSDSQVVFRFTLQQIIFSAVAFFLISFTR